MPITDNQYEYMQLANDIRCVYSFCLLIEVSLKDDHPHSIRFPAVLSHLLHPLSATFICMSSG